jgi:hypothetical protein
VPGVSIRDRMIFVGKLVLLNERNKLSDEALRFSPELNPRFTIAYPKWPRLCDARSFAVPVARIPSWAQAHHMLVCICLPVREKKSLG